MAKATVLNITGKVIYEEVVNTNVQMNNLSQGTYSVRVSTGSETSICENCEKNRS